ncbi:putative cyclin [Rosa chinensis]|uniref:Putative cyclin n=1 Tax=Rosa chinensis TaxID=74649 RepID=A0A2P6R5X4_ROSCH|nr:putative cyclin [Rosa chinensis]
MYGVPHLTIATAKMLCHCFYMHQSHAKNDWPEFFRKQKELIVVAEKALLTTIDFDLDIQLTYKTLVVVLKRLNIPDLAKVAKVAWHLIDQWLQTSLCLQYKPHYIAAGSIALVARILEVKLPTEKGKIWWLEIDVAPEQLDVIC